LALLLLTALPTRAADLRLGDDVVPKSQAIFLELDAAESHYRGSVTVEIEVKQPTRRILLHSENHEIVRITLEIAEGEVLPTAHEMADFQTLAITTETALPRGPYTLRIDFRSAFGTRAVGLYRMEAEGQAYTFTQFESDDAREAFPCWDEPEFKIPFQMTLKVPAKHLAISNTPVEKETQEDGWRTYSFRQTRPLPTYLLLIATGPLEAHPVPGLDLPTRIVTLPGQGHLTGLAMSVTPPLLEALEEYFGTPYPYAKLDLLAVPEFWPGGMENAGAITFTDDAFLLDPSEATLTQRRWHATLIAHELAHQWFGNLVTMRWWDDLWLNESFANWMGEKISTQVYPELGGELTYEQHIQEIFRTDARPGTAPIRHPVDSAKNLLEGLQVTYKKGTAILEMFEGWLGEDDFRQGIRSYLQAHAWGNAEAADLWRSLDESSNKKLSTALATFIDQPGHPLVSVHLAGEGRVTLRQERFLNHGVSASAGLWKVPVRLRYPAGDRMITQTVLLETEQMTLALELPENAPEQEWIIPQADAVGFYRWRLETAQMREMITHAGERLTPQERVGLLGNVSALLDAGLLDGGDHLGLLAELADDPEPLVLDAALTELARAGLLVPDDLQPLFDTWIRQTFGPTLDRLGLEARPGESETVAQVRPRLLGLLGRAGRQDLLDFAHAQAKSYLAAPSSVDPSLVRTVLRLAAQDGGQELFDTYLEHFLHARSPATRTLLLEVFGAFDSDLRRQALDSIGTDRIRPDEVFDLLSAVSSDEEGRQLAFHWIRDHESLVLELLPPVYIVYLPYFAGGCSAERLKEAQTFFLEPGRRTPALARSLHRVGEEVQQCLELRQREGDAVKRYLTEAVPGFGPLEVEEAG
jgi:alanyl aminopeptidase